MEKLGQLRAEAVQRRWDLIIVDTPPSRSALDFLDAPNGWASFLDGRFIRLLSAPAKAGGRAGLKVFGVGVQSSPTRWPRSSVVSSSATCRPSWLPWTRCSAASGSAPTRPTRCSRRPGRRSSSWRRRSVTRCARRRTSSSGSARRMPLAGSWSTGCSGSAAAALTPSRAWPPPRSSPTPGTASRRPPTTAGLLRLHAAWRTAAQRSAAGRAVLRRAPRHAGRRGAGSGTGRPRPRRAAGDRRGAPPRADSTTQQVVPMSASPGVRYPRGWVRRLRGLGPSASEGLGEQVPPGRDVRALRSSARRSRSVIPPQTPNSVRLSRASARHCASTGQVLQTAFASCCAAPRTKRASGSCLAHAARLRPVLDPTCAKTVTTVIRSTPSPFGASRRPRFRSRLTGPDQAALGRNDNSKGPNRDIGRM